MHRSISQLLDWDGIGFGRRSSSVLTDLMSLSLSRFKMQKNAELLAHSYTLIQRTTPQKA